MAISHKIQVRNMIEKRPEGFFAGLASLNLASAQSSVKH